MDWFYDCFGDRALFGHFETQKCENEGLRGESLACHGFDEKEV